MKKLSEFDKISQVIESKQISIAKAERMSGLGSGTISKLKDRSSGTGSLQPDNLQKFLRTFHVNQEWWETGIGDMYDIVKGPISEVSKNEQNEKLPSNYSGTSIEALVRALEKAVDALAHDNKAIIIENGKLIDIISNITSRNTA